jgi:hypothetical protein
MRSELAMPSSPADSGPASRVWCEGSRSARHPSPIGHAPLERSASLAQRVSRRPNPGSYGGPTRPPAVRIVGAGSARRPHRGAGEPWTIPTPVESENDPGGGDAHGQGGIEWPGVPKDTPAKVIRQPGQGPVPPEMRVRCRLAASGGSPAFPVAGVLRVSNGRRIRPALTWSDPRTTSQSSR